MTICTARPGSARLGSARLTSVVRHVRLLRASITLVNIYEQTPTDSTALSAALRRSAHCPTSVRSVHWSCSSSICVCENNITDTCNHRRQGARLSADQYNPKKNNVCALNLLELNSVVFVLFWHGYRVLLGVVSMNYMNYTDSLGIIDLHIGHPYKFLSNNALTVSGYYSFFTHCIINVWSKLFY